MNAIDLCTFGCTRGDFTRCHRFLKGFCGPADIPTDHFPGTIVQALENKYSAGHKGTKEKQTRELVDVVTN